MNKSVRPMGSAADFRVSTVILLRPSTRKNRHTEQMEEKWEFVGLTIFKLFWSAFYLGGKGR